MIYEDYFKSVIGGNFKSPEYYSTYENKTYEPIQVNTMPNNFNDTIDLYPDIYKVVLPMVDKMLVGKDVNSLDEIILDKWTLEIYDSLEAEDNINKNNQIYESETTSSNKVGNITDTKMVNSNPITNLNQLKSNQAINLNNSNQVTSLNQLNKINQTTNLSSRLNNSNLSQTVSSNQTMNNQNNYAKNVINSNIQTKEVSNSNIQAKEVINSNVQAKEETVDVVSRYQNRKNPLLRDLIKIMILNRIFGNNNYNRPPRPPYPNFSRETYSPYVVQNNQEPSYKSVDANPYSKYLKNKPKTYFDTPYPEEG